MFTDSYNRIHNYLRIALTNKCNLRCTYCCPVDLPRGFFAGAIKMTADEIESIATVFVKEGVNKIRLTGGEPLIRKDTKEIIQRLSKFPVELTITTNGVFVDEFINTFKESGLHSVNVSLDSLEREKYFKITKRDEYIRVKKNIDLLIANDFNVKVNAVMIKGVNDDEILNFVEWTKHQPVHVRFIEFMPFKGNQWSNMKVFPRQEIMNIIGSRYSYIKLADKKNETAKKYVADGHQGTFAVISTMSAPFCTGCNRLRLTTDGKMKNCLFSKKEVDILSALRNGEDILPLIKLCVSNKEQALGGQFSATYKTTNATRINNRSMIKIGG